jgi:hypothetical protein
MFGLLKKSDFDAEMIFLKSQMNSNVNEINNIQNNSFELLKQLIKIQEETRQQLNIIEKLIYTQQSNQIQSKSVEFNNKIDFVGLTDFLSNLYKNKTCLIDDENRILEPQLQEEICNYLKNQQNMIISSKKQYPKNFPENYSERLADILIINQNQEIQSIIELKRWDIAYSSDKKAFTCSIENDRALHYIALNKLALSKSVNPQIKHYYICVYENNDIFKKGYIAAKKASNSVGYGPLTTKQKPGDKFIDFDKIKKEYSINYEISDEQKNILEDSFKKMYLSSGVFDFDYIDNLISNNKFRNIFLKKQCRVIQDKQINNTNLNQQQINNYSEKELAVLPVNWRIRIIEVL